MEETEKTIEDSIMEINRELENLMVLAQQLSNCSYGEESYTRITDDIRNSKLPNIYKGGKKARLFAIEYIVNHFDEWDVQMCVRDNIIISLLDPKKARSSSNIVIGSEHIYEDGLSLLAESTGSKSTGALLSTWILDAFFSNLDITRVENAINRLWRRSKKEIKKGIEYSLITRRGLFKRTLLGLKYNKKGGDKEGLCLNCAKGSLAFTANTELKIIERRGEVRIYQCKKCGERIEEVVAYWERSSRNKEKRQ